MAHLWVRDGHHGWRAEPLTEAMTVLTAPPRDRRPDEPSTPDRPVAVVRVEASRDATWAVMAGPGVTVWVNGAPVAGGLRLLCDRDEVRVGMHRVFFSSERLASVESMPATGEPVRCQRCRQSIEPDSPAVRCPQCGIWHHQSDGLPCWTYADTCAMCSQPTSGEATYRWTPEDL